MLWTLPDHCPSAAQLQQVARSVGVGIHPLNSGSVLYGDLLPGFERHALLGYVHLNPAEIEEGIELIAGALAKPR
jgi:GntR family transcriptional regulator/MocR family aminotransferase